MTLLDRLGICNNKSLLRFDDDDDGAGDKNGGGKWLFSRDDVPGWSHIYLHFMVGKMEAIPNRSGKLLSWMVARYELVLDVEFD